MDGRRLTLLTQVIVGAHLWRGTEGAGGKAQRFFTPQWQSFAKQSYVLALQALCRYLEQRVLPGATLVQTEGVTGSYRNWQRGETRDGAAQKDTTKHSGKGSSEGPMREQQGPLAAP